jgi:hypothetical protein
MTRFFVVALMALFPLNFAQAQDAEKAPAAAPATEIDHTPFHALLKSNVKGSKVNYDGFAKSAEFKAYVALLGKTDPATLSSRSARLAFWINAYNALTINAVLAYYPKIKSVLKVTPDFFKSKTRTVGNKKVSLDEIENKIIRPKFNDPRIHAALNCASVSCPPLANFAFTPKGLNGQLNKVFKAFVNDTTRNQIDPGTGTVKISKIFDWYGVDFKKAGGPGKYMAGFMGDEAKKKALNEATAIQFLPYDWNLNKL